MHPRSYCKGVLATETKNKTPSFSSTMMLINIIDYFGAQVYFCSFRCWFLRMTSLVVMPSTLKTSVKF